MSRIRIIPSVIPLDDHEWRVDFALEVLESVEAVTFTYQNLEYTLRESETITFQGVMEVEQ